MAIIRLYRRKEQYNRKFPYTILLNGKKIQTLENGGTTTIVTGQEVARLRVKFMWCGSREISLSEINDPMVTLKVGANKNLHRQLLGMPLIIIVVNILFLMLRNMFCIEYLTAGVLASLLLYCLFLLTVKRNSWLTLEIASKDLEAIFYTSSDIP